MFIEFVKLQWSLFLMLAVIIILLFMDPIRKRASGVTTATQNDAIRLLQDDNSVVIDVSTEAEFNTGHIAGAINSPARGLTNDLDRLSKYKSRNVLLTCRNGQQSMRASGQLVKAGFENVSHLQGGMTNWIKDNLPVERNT